MARRHRGGANALEFGLTLPVFILLLFGIIEYGWLFFIDSVMNTAVADGCREGSILDPGFGERNSGVLLERATDVMFETLAAYGADNCDDCSAFVRLIDQAPARSLYCEATWTVTPLLGLTSDEVTVTASTSTRLEWQR